MEDVCEHFGVTEQTLRSLAARYSVVLMVLFGSAARGKARKDSDTDVGLWLEDPLGATQETRLIRDLAHAFRSDDIDPVILNHASPLLLFEVAESGRLLFEKEEGDYDRFKLRAMKYYWEYAKFRKYTERALEVKEKRLRPL